MRTSPAKPLPVQTGSGRRLPRARAAVTARLKSARWKLWAKRAGILLVVLLALPVVEVGCVRFVRPPCTPLMALRYAEAEWSGGAHPKRVLYHWMDWPELPREFLRAVWVSEDARFFRHHGFDWIEFHAAMAQAERTGKPPRGTSTISMQCARSLFLWQGHSYVRKALEAYYTFWMETLLSKQRIFELYANVIEMGDGVYGIGAASHFWYQKSPAQLTTSEAAMLASMLPNPRRWNPRTPTRRLAARQRRALSEMTVTKWPVDAP